MVFKINKATLTKYLLIYIGLCTIRNSLTELKRSLNAVHSHLFTTTVFIVSIDEIFRVQIHVKVLGTSSSTFL